MKSWGGSTSGMTRGRLSFLSVSCPPDVIQTAAARIAVITFLLIANNVVTSKKGKYYAPNLINYAKFVSIIANLKSQI